MIFNAGVFPCNRQSPGMKSSPSIAVPFKRQEMAILGIQFPGDMNQGVFTVMNYVHDAADAQVRAAPCRASSGVARVRENWEGHRRLHLLRAERRGQVYAQRRTEAGPHRRQVVFENFSIMDKAGRLPLDVYPGRPQPREGRLPLEAAHPSGLRRFWGIAADLEVFAGAGDVDEGTRELEATFSASFGARFLVWTTLRCLPPRWTGSA